MPRSTPATPPRVEPPQEPPNSIVASAANVSQGPLRPRRAGALDWQKQAWGYYDIVGELRFASNWLGNALSRVTLHIDKLTDDGPEKQDEGKAVDILDALFEGPTGQSQMMRSLGIHLTVPGESYVVAEPQPGKRPDEWLVLSTEEITARTSGQWVIDRGDGKKRVLAPDSLVIRVWRPHPRRWVEADSSVRAVLPVLRELEQLTKHVAANIDSRLAGAGLLLLPSEMTYSTPTPPDTTGVSVGVPGQDPFLDVLAEAMIKPIEDRSSAAAIVPIVIKAPGSTLADVRLVSFSSPLDEQAQSLREEAIRRLALGMDLPPEVMLGQSDSNHWSAWQIDESALKIHVEPMCEIIADAFTREYLWPALEADGSLDYDLVVGFDTAELRLRPDHSQQAVELYDRLQLSGEALRRETGFDEGDAPDDDELEQIILLQLAAGTSQLQSRAVAKLGVDLSDEEDTARFLPQARPVPQAAPEAPQQQAPQRGLPQQPETAPGTEAPQSVAAVLASAEVLALRALERANNRLNHRRSARRLPTTAEIEDALRDAWTGLPQCAQLLSVDAGTLQKCLDGYVRATLARGGRHDRARLLVALSGGGDGR